MFSYFLLFFRIDYLIKYYKVIYISELMSFCMGFFWVTGVQNCCVEVLHLWKKYTFNGLFNGIWIKAIIKAIVTQITQYNLS